MRKTHRFGIPACLLLPAIILSAGLASADGFEVAGQSLRGYASTLLVDGELAYVTMGSALVVFRVSGVGPGAPPVEVGRAYIPYCFDGNPALGTFGGVKYVFAPTDLYGVWVFDVHDPVRPVAVASLFNPATDSLKEPGGGVFVQGDYVYWANGNRGLKIFQVKTLSGGGLSFELKGQQPAVEYFLNVHVTGGRAYLAARGGGLVIVDVNNPASPTQVGSYNVGDPKGGPVIDVVVDGNLAILAHSFLPGWSGGGGVETVRLDFTDPKKVTATRIAAFNETIDFYRDLSRDGIRVAAANATKGVYLFDIPADGTITRLASMPTDNLSAQVTLIGDTLHLANCADDYQVARYAGGSITPITRADAGVAHDVAVLDGYAYVADGHRGVSVVDVRDPYAPGRESLPVAPTVHEFSDATGIAYDDGFFYVADGPNGVVVLRKGEGGGASFVASYPVCETDGEGSPCYAADRVLASDASLYVSANATVGGVSRGGVARFAIGTGGSLLEDGGYFVDGATCGAMSASGGYLYLAGQVGGKAEVLVVDPENDMAGAGTIADPATDPANTAAQDIAFQERDGKRYLFVSTANTNVLLNPSYVARFRLYDATADALHPALLHDVPVTSTAFPVDLRVGVQGLVPQDDRLFLMQQNVGPVLYRIGDPAIEAPVLLGYLMMTANNNSGDMIEQDGFLYNAHGDAGLYVLAYGPPALPTVGGVTPATAKAGAEVTVAGGHFGAARGQGYVTFNGARATACSAWADDAIRVTVPSGAVIGSGPAAVRVWPDGERPSNWARFEVTTGGCSLGEAPSDALPLVLVLVGLAAASATRARKRHG